METPTEYQERMEREELEVLWARVLTAFEGAFMRPQVTQGDWVTVTTTEDEQFSIPMDFFNFNDFNVSRLEVERRAWGARLSASGRMDCTDWCVFESANEAMQYLLKQYADE